MSNIDLLSMAIKNLVKRKLRTFLTVLGVIIGSTAIIIMISIGVGVNLSFEEQIQNMPDATLLQIQNWTGYSGYTMGAAVLDDEALAEIADLPGVKAVTPYVPYFYMYAKSGRYSAEIPIVGMDITKVEEFGYTLLEGSYITEGDTYGVLFGSNVGYEFKTDRERNSNRWSWLQSSREQKLNVNVLKDKISASPDWNYIQPQQTATGTEGGYDEGYEESQQQTLKPLKAVNLNGVGILDSSRKYEMARSSIMDVNTVLQLKSEYEAWQQKAYGNRAGVSETHGYEQALVLCETINDIQDVVAAIKEYNFDWVSNPTEFIDSLKEMMDTLQIMLSTIGAVSLFVAAIGIANTMVMSIHERTREIGVMKVIGASLKDIKKLFLIEASLIGLMGGILGVGFSYIVSYTINNMEISLFSQLMQGMSSANLSVIPMWLALLALGFSAFIGLISGYIPAVRATKLSALNAIRTE